MNLRHPSVDRLAGYGEANPNETTRLSGHLARCQPCRDRLSRIRRLRNDLADATAPALPADLWSGIQADLDAGRTVLLPTGSPARAPARRVRSQWIQAAVLTLLVSAGALALPGSPLRERLWPASGLSGDDIASTRASSVPALHVAAPIPDRGLVIVVEPGAASVDLRVDLTGEEMVEVEVQEPGESTSIQTSGDRLVLRDAGGPVRIGTPRGTAGVLVEAGGRVLVVSDGEALWPAGAAEGVASMRITLRPTGEKGQEERP